MPREGIVVETEAHYRIQVYEKSTHYWQAKHVLPKHIVFCIEPIEFYVAFFMFHTSLSNSCGISILFHISVVCGDASIALLYFLISTEHYLHI